MASSIQYRRSATNGNTPIPARLLSMGSQSGHSMRPMSSATSIDGTSDIEDSRKQPTRGWQTRKQDMLMRTMVVEERDDVSDAESFDSLSSRAKFMSDLLSDSDSSIDGRNSISSYGPATPRTPSPEYLEDGFPMVEIAGEKSPRSSRASSMEVSPTFAAKVKAMTTVGPRGPHLFRSYSTSHSTNISHITIPSPRNSLPPTPLLTDSSRSPSLYKVPESPHRTPRIGSARSTPRIPQQSPHIGAPPQSPRMPQSPRVPQSPRIGSGSPQHTPRLDSEPVFHGRPRSELLPLSSEFDLEEVRSWAPNQVCAWMAALGFELEMVEKFARNDITGAILIDLKWEDLKELDIQSFGKRTELWNEILHLRARGIPTPDRAEFIRTSSRVTRSSSSSTVSAASRARSGSSTSVASQMMAVPEVDDQTVVGFEIRAPSSRPVAPQPQTHHQHQHQHHHQHQHQNKPQPQPQPQGNSSDEADEEGTDDGVRTRSRPVVRRKRRTNVRMPQRQVSVDSIVITSDDEFPGSYIAKIEALTSFDHGRPLRRNMSLRDSVTPSDSVSLRGRKQKKKSKQPTAEGQSRPHQCKKGDRCRKHGKVTHTPAPVPVQTMPIPTPARPNSDMKSEHGTIVIATTPSIADFSALVRDEDGVVQGSPRPQSDYTSPSVIASSDALGPIQSKEIKLKESVLREVSRLDPQENVKQFLTHQHLQHLEERRHSPPPVPTKSASDILRAQRQPSPPSPPPPAPRDTATPPHASYGPRMQSLPPSAITAATLAPPTPSPPLRSQTPSFGLRIQGMEQVVPPYANFSVPSRVRSPAMMRTTTPFSEADVPCSAGTPINFRDQSQSVPPELHYRRFPTPTMESLTAPIVPRSVGANIPRSQSTRPTLNMVEESAEWEMVDDGEVKMAPSPSMRTHSGWMKKRRTNWFRHEWPDYHFVLRGTRLGYARDVATGEVGSIDMDQYQVACSNSGSTKLSAAFKAGKIFGKKKEDGTPGSYFFQLVPADGPTKGKKNIGKVHCFAVNSREERIDWMRELMLAKAIKQKGQGFEVEVNGEKV